MFSLTGDFNPIIVDVVFGFIVLIAFLIGFLKGFKKIAFNLILRVLAFVLAFTTTLGFLKKAILSLVNFSLISTGNEFLDYLLGLSNVFVVSLLLYFIIYRLLKIIVFLFKKTFHIKKKRKKLLNRLLGGLANASFYLVTVSILLKAIATPFIGLNSLVEGTTVSKQAVAVVDLVFDMKLLEENARLEKIFVVVVEGNILNKTTEEDLDLIADSFDDAIDVFFNFNKYYQDNLNDGSMEVEQLNQIINEMFENIVVFSELSILVKNQYPGILTLTDNLFNKILSFFPDTNAVDIDPLLKDRVVESLTQLDGDANVREAIFEKIGHSA